MIAELGDTKLCGIGSAWLSIANLTISPYHHAVTDKWHFSPRLRRNSFMILKTQLRQYIAWLALFAVLFGSLAPSLAQASVALTGKQWVEICTATGTVHVQVDDESRTDAADVPEHCPFLLSLQHLSPVPSTALPHPPVPPACAVAFFPTIDLPSLALQFRVAHPAHAPPHLS
jgi:hypothetical protein